MTDPCMESPIARRREKEKDRRRQEIMEAAKKVFFARDYARASMDDIAREAGVTKPTVYSYFRTRDELYYSLTLPVIERLNSDMEAMRAKMNAGSYPSGREILRDHFRTYHEISAADPGALRLLLLMQQPGIIRNVEADIRASILSRVKERYEGMRAIYAAAIERKLIREVNVHHLVDMIWGTFQGIIQSTGAKTMDGGPEADEKLARILGPTLDFAEKVIADALALK